MKLSLSTLVVLGFLVAREAPMDDGGSVDEWPSGECVSRNWSVEPEGTPVCDTGADGCTHGYWFDEGRGACVRSRSGLSFAQCSAAPADCEGLYATLEQCVTACDAPETPAAIGCG